MTDQPKDQPDTTDGSSTAEPHPADTAEAAGSVESKSFDPNSTGSFLPGAASSGFDPDGTTSDHGHHLAAGAADFSLSEIVKPAEGDAPRPIVAGYEVLGVLGRGGMGVVYKARQRGLKRIVALKMILAGAHATAQDLARFHTEAEAVAQLQHANIVQLYEVGEHEGRPFFSLEFVPGGSLARKLKNEPQQPRQAAETCRLLAGAMDYAHRHGVIHCDLKPGNVLLAADGTPKVSDFGLAKRLEDDSLHTQSGTLLGTPSYMSPEQASGKIKDVGPLADVYSLGAVLYEMLTGRPPFKGTSLWETVELVRTREPVPPSQLQPTLPRDLETVCLKCLQKEPAKRYPSGGELAADLQRFLNGEAIAARPVSAAERLWRWCRRNPRVAALATAAPLLIVAWAGTATGMYFQIKAEKARTEKQKEIAEDNERIADIRADAAVRNANVARGQYLQGIDSQVAVIREMSRELQPRPGEGHDPARAALRAKLIKLAREQMTEQARGLQDSGLSPYALVAAHQKLGDLFAELGEHDEALAQFIQGCDLVRQVARDKPSDDKALGNLEVVLGKVWNATLNAGGDLAAAAERYREAYEMQQQVVARALDAPPPERDKAVQEAERRLLEYQWQLIRAANLLGDPVRAEPVFQAINSYWKSRAQADGATAEARSWLSLSHALLGDVKSLQRDFPASQQHHEAAMQLCRALIQEVPRNTSYKVDLVYLEDACGDAWFRHGDVAAAERRYQAHQSALEEICRREGKVFYFEVLASTYERLGQAALRQQAASQAEAHFRKALALRAQLAKARPSLLPPQMDLCVAQARVGNAADAARRAAEHLQKLPRNPEVRLPAARTFAVCARRTTDSAEARRWKDQALALLGEAVERGYRDVVTLETGPDWDALRSKARFKKLLGRTGSR